MVATRTAPGQMLTIGEVAAVLRFTDLVEYMKNLPAAPPEQSAGSAA
jgi:hypothetical protein